MLSDHNKNICAIVFPAFVNEYIGSEREIISEYHNHFDYHLNEASEVTGLNLKDFDFRGNNFLDHELKSQYISYIFSCTLSDILKTEGVQPSFVSGYSMGLYSALYYCNSTSYTDGLLITKHAFEIISKLSQSCSYSACMIVGLEEKDVTQLIHGHNDVKIINQNNNLTFIIAGKKEIIISLLDRAKTEGAIHTRLLPVSLPYHTSFIQGAEIEFGHIIKDIKINSPDFPVISGINQMILTTSEQIRMELAKNLVNPLNWMRTMNKLILSGTKLIYECGAGNSLYKNARFIEGDFKIFSVNKLKQFLISR